MYPPKGNLYRLAHRYRKQSSKNKSKKTVAKAASTGKFFDHNTYIELSMEGLESTYYPSPAFAQMITEEMEPEFEVKDGVIEDAEIIPEPQEDDKAALETPPIVQEDAEIIPEPENSSNPPVQESHPPVVEDAEIIEEEPARSPKGNLGKLQRKMESTDTAKQRLAEEMQQLNFEDDDFARDLQSILAGDAVYDPNKKTVTSPSSSPQTPSIPQPTTPQGQQTEQKQNPHAIFDELAQKFSAAKTYDLGEVALEQRFDQFDEEADRTPPPLALEQMDILEDFERMELPQQQSKKKDDKKLMHPKDPSSGGGTISHDELQAGDIILSTTNDWISTTIRKLTDSPVSHSAVYIGKNPVTKKHEVMESLDDGVTTMTLDDSMFSDTVTAAFRHPSMTKSIAEKITQFLKVKEKEGAKFDYIAMIKHLPFRIHASLCEKLPGPVAAVCKDIAQKVYLGTEENNEFYCSELVFEAFKQAGLPLAQIPSDWSTPQDLVELSYNGSLHYVGHLKA